jgi:hypothetical protein
MHVDCHSLPVLWWFCCYFMWRNVLLIFKHHLWWNCFILDLIGIDDESGYLNLPTIAMTLAFSNSTACPKDSCSAAADVVIWMFVVLQKTFDWSSRPFDLLFAESSVRSFNHPSILNGALPIKFLMRRFSCTCGLKITFLSYLRRILQILSVMPFT